MVQRGVEHRLFGLGALHLQAREFLFPGLFRLAAELVKALVSGFGLQVFERTGHARG